MHSPALDRSILVDWYVKNRARSRAIFDLIDPSAYYSRPIALRNPIVFYEGHLPAFSVLSFLRRGLGGGRVDARLVAVFARGIDPDRAHTAVPRSGADTRWPSRDEVLAFGARADDAIVRAINDADFADDRPAMRRGEGLYTALEHEAMHQETLLYMWHRLPYEQKRRPATELLPDGGRQRIASAPLAGGTVRIPAGVATLGADRGRIPFGWDNEFDRHQVEVAPFDIDAHNVTNGDYLAFVEAGGYRTRELWSAPHWAWLQQDRVRYAAFWLMPDDDGPAQAPGERVDAPHWRGMFEAIPLPLDWPVYVSQAEATAYARWKGRRLPTEAEFHRAAFGTPSGAERAYPWGDAAPDTSQEVARRGNFDFHHIDPVPVGSYPAGASAWGVHDLVGNGWEWTSTPFAPFPGFVPMASYPEYSADFFDGQHYVMKGASPATAGALIRRSFRNWFRPNYPYVYAGFRTVGQSLIANR
jgi:ergothioneine biosynthesis protein EgtB